MPASPQDVRNSLDGLQVANRGDAVNLSQDVKEKLAGVQAVTADEMSPTVAGLRGQLNIIQQTAGSAIGKIADKLGGTLGTLQLNNTLDARNAGYNPPITIDEVMQDNAMRDPVGVFVQRMGMVNGPGGVDVIGPTGPESSPVLEPPFPPVVPPPPPILAPPIPMVPPGDCVVIPPKKPGELPTYICHKDPIGTPGGPDNPPTLPPISPPPPPPPDIGTCPPPDIIIPTCPAPVIIVTPPVPPLVPSNPPTTPPPPPDDFQCPEPPVVNVDVAAPVVNIPPQPEVKKLQLEALGDLAETTFAIGWDQDNGCQEAVDTPDRWKIIIGADAGPLKDIADKVATTFGSWISNRLGIAQNNGVTFLSRAFSVFVGGDDASDASGGLKAMASGFSVVRYLYSHVKSNMGEDAAIAMGPATMRAALMAGGKEIDFDFQYFLQPYVYEQQYIYPVYIPDQGTIDALYLGDRITKEQHTCYTRAQGNLPHLHTIAMEEKRSRLGESQWVELYMRKQIDFDRLIRECRKLGWLDGTDVARLPLLRQQFPPFGDIIRMMIRDVQNPQVVADAGLEKGFDDNFNGQLKDWAEYQGMTVDVAKAYWKAHWNLPSNTALFDMLHRLRPGAVSDELAVTADLVQKTIEANDLAPAFVKRVMALSYSPLTRVDARRAYFVDVLNDGQLKSAYMDLGYDSDKADTLVKYTKIEKRKFIANQTGVWGLGKITSEYLNNSIDEGTARMLAARILTTDDQVDILIRDINLKREAEAVAACLKALKKRFMVGEYTTAELTEAIIGYGIGLSQALTMTKAWGCERSGRRKEIPAAQLCKWVEQGLINQTEYTTRLANLGFEQGDITRIAASCEIDLTLKAKKAADKALKEEKADIAKSISTAKANLKDIEKKLKDAQKAYDDYVKAHPQPNG